MPEHKPMTDEELAGLEQALEHARNRAVEPGKVERCVAEGRRRNYSTLLYTSMPRLIAEVRRLRDYRVGNICRMCRKYWDGQRATFCPECEVRARELGVGSSLTLQNGTVVRARDVLVWGGVAIKVMGVGEKIFIGKQIAQAPNWDRNLGPEELFPWPESISTGGPNMLQWSEVYPDRPVPGGDQ